MKYVTPQNCDIGIFVKLKDGSWRSLLKGRKVEMGLLDPKFLDLALKIGRLEEINESILIEAKDGN